MDSKKYIIGKCEYVIPKTTLKQYKQISKIVKENLQDVKIASGDKEQLTIDLGRIIITLLENNALEELLAAIFGHPEVSAFEEIDDETLVEVLTDFFSGKAALISNTISSFGNLQKDSKEQAAE